MPELCGLQSSATFLLHRQSWRSGLDCTDFTDFASKATYEPYFFGAKFVQFPEGSIFLYIELIAEKEDGGLNPQERNSATLLVSPSWNKGVPDSVSVPSGGQQEDYDAMTTETLKSNWPGTGGPPAVAAAALQVQPGSDFTVSTLKQAPTPSSFATTQSSFGNTDVVVIDPARSSGSQSVFSGGGASHRDARSVKSRLTVMTLGGTKRKLSSSVGKCPKDGQSPSGTFEHLMDRVRSIFFEANQMKYLRRYAGNIPCNMSL